MKTEFLNPSRTLVETVAEWLLRRARKMPVGTPSLSHLLVVVPTAQSGRQLRRVLAQKACEAGFGGILPPLVRMPMQLVEARDQSLRTATPAQARAAFLRFVGLRPDGVFSEWPHLFHRDSAEDSSSLLSFYDQLEDIWRILSNGGLRMADVPGDERARRVLDAAQGDESVRWEELAGFERAFFGFLRENGLRHGAESIAMAKREAKPFSPEVEEVVLPALVDPVSVLYDVLRQSSLPVTVLLHADAADAPKFDEWGRPRIDGWTGSARPILDGLRDEDIVRAGTDTELAARIAADFPAVGDGKAFPSLGLTDEALFPELSAAFLNRGTELHNPERHRVSVSSLGRILNGLLSLGSVDGHEYPWDALVALLREDDVLSAVRARLSNVPRAAILAGIDVCRNSFFPASVSPKKFFDETSVHPRDRESVAAFRAAVETLDRMMTDARRGAASPEAFLGAMLKELYGARSFDGSAGEEEFRAAAEAVRAVLSEFGDGFLSSLGLSPKEGAAILRRSLAEASYSLEAPPGVVRTEGWLELAWSDSEKIALAGFGEGCVPDSVMGHAFVPDSLRRALGLTSNEQRLARDTFLLKELLESRRKRPGTVRAYVALTDNDGNVKRPSRLLFLVPDERLASRVRSLFGPLPPGEPGEPRRVVDAWRPRLPDAVPLPQCDETTPEGRLSASAIDAWLGCPFRYLLQYGLGMEHVETKDELGANDFGTLVHAVLQRYAEEQLDRTAKGIPQRSDATEIKAALKRFFADAAAKYGAEPSLNLRLQLDSALSRLLCFADVQAEWARDGWVVAEKPEFRFLVRPFQGEDGCDVWVKGSVDRIDFKEGVGYRLIDYKTWDEPKTAAKHVWGKGTEEWKYAQTLGLPVDSTEDTGDGKKARRMISVQLPLYGACLEAHDPRKFKGRIRDYGYLILGKNASQIGFYGSSDPVGVTSRSNCVLADWVPFALETARTAIRHIRGNLFWPPGPSGTWAYDFKDLFVFSPEVDLPDESPWRRAQFRNDRRIGGVR